MTDSGFGVSVLNPVKVNPFMDFSVLQNKSLPYASEWIGRYTTSLTAPQTQTYCTEIRLLVSP